VQQDVQQNFASKMPSDTNQSNGKVADADLVASLEKEVADMEKKWRTKKAKGWIYFLSEDSSYHTVINPKAMKKFVVGEYVSIDNSKFGFILKIGHHQGGGSRDFISVWWLPVLDNQISNSWCISRLASISTTTQQPPVQITKEQLEEIQIKLRESLAVEEPTRQVAASTRSKTKTLESSGKESSVTGGSSRQDFKEMKEELKEKLKEELREELKEEIAEEMKEVMKKELKKEMKTELKKHQIQKKEPEEKKGERNHKKEEKAKKRKHDESDAKPKKKHRRAKFVATVSFSSGSESD